MKHEADPPPNRWMSAVAIAIGVIVFVSVYQMNMKGYGKGSQPMFAIPAAMMVTCIYAVSFLMLENIKSATFKWLVLGIFAVFATAFGLWIAGQ